MWPFQLVLMIYAVRVIGYLGLRLKRRPKEGNIFIAGGKDRPSVDIILPMYNEESVVVKTIRNLLEIEYEQFTIIVVDDGSTDRSFDVVEAQFGDHPQVRLFSQPNMGKSAALNKGMTVSEGDIVVTIDADTWVSADAIQNIVPYFQHEHVAAVAGHIKVGNRVNLLTEMQYYEYVALWDNDRAFSDPVNGILIVPGALAAYRRSAVYAVGGFKSEVIAEDTELTLRLLYNGYVLRNTTGAVAYTEAPDSLKMFFRQRVRWTTGLSQGLIKHSKKLFTHSNKWLGFFILPYTWAFRVVLPFFLPIVDYYFLFLLFTGRWTGALTWWPLIILTEACTNLYLLAKNGERIGVFNLILIQRLYRHLLFCNYWFIFGRGVNGTLFKWSKLTRKGNLKLEKGASPLVQKSNNYRKTPVDYEQ